MKHSEPATKHAALLGDSIAASALTSGDVIITAKGSGINNANACSPSLPLSRTR